MKRRAALKCLPLLGAAPLVSVARADWSAPIETIYSNDTTHIFS